RSPRESPCRWLMAAASRSFIASVLVAGVVLSAFAGPAEDAFERKDYLTALRLWRERAEKNDTEAQIRSGAMYADGQGVERSYEIAANWFRRAANQGSARAQFNLGSMYYHGQGVRQSYEDAAHWLSFAAAQGHTIGSYMLGLLYAEGRGVP